MIIAFTLWATSVSAVNVLQTFEWTYEMNYGRLAVAWGLFIFHVFVIIFTGIRLGKEPGKYPEKAKKILVFSLITIAVVYAVMYGIGIFNSRILHNMLSDGGYNYAFSMLISVYSIIRQYVISIALTFVLTSAIRYIKLIRNAK